MGQDTITIKDIIENEWITTYYQPIVSLINGEILGYESLSRGPKDTHFFSPINLIRASESEQCIWDLEMLFRKKAIEHALQISSNKLLFLNVDPKIILDSNYKSGITKAYLQRYGIDPRNIVFEITERTAIDDYDNFRQIIDHYKDQSYNIAIDDVGSGYSGLKSITELKPDYVKIDMDLIRDIDKDVFKSSVIKGLVSVAKDTGLYLIAEGVETHAELRTLIELGVHYAQGYLLQRPSPTISHQLTDIRDMILQLKRDIISAFSYDSAYFIIGKIARQGKSFLSSTPCEKIKNIFDSHDLDSLTLCDKDNIPEGLIMRNKFNSKLADRYGYDLYSQRSVRLLMNLRPLLIDYYTPVNQVLSLAMQRDKKNLYDDIIVTKGSGYYGTVSVYEIIRYTTEFEKMYAKQLNPLTSLPGNTIIRQVLAQYIASGEVIGLLYIDLDHFKSYNDVYGFEEGDIILKRTGNLIEQITAEANDRNFIGHIGGDDYVAIIHGRESRLSELCKAICHQFTEMIQDFFSEDDQAKGYYIAKDRYDQLRKYPLTSITIAGVYGSLSDMASVEYLGKYMGNIKREAKAFVGNNYLLKYVDKKSES